MTVDLNKKYKFGIKVSRKVGGRGRITTYICNCKATSVLEQPYGVPYVCEGCGNDYFIDDKPNYNSWMLSYYESNIKKNKPIFIPIEVDGKSFKVKRVNITFNYSNGALDIVKEGRLDRMVECNLLEKRIEMFDNGVSKFKVDSDVQGGERELLLEHMNKAMLTGANEDDFIKAISHNEGMREMYSSLMKNLGTKGYNIKYRPLLAISKFMNLDMMFVQVLASSNFSLCNDIIRKVKYRSQLPRFINKSATKPHEILGLTKSIYRELVNEKMGLSAIEDVHGFIKGNDYRASIFSELVSIVKDEAELGQLTSSLDVLASLSYDYDYKDLRKLVLYAFRECKHTQGIANGNSALILLRDYVRMSRAIGLPHEKYPKSLKKAHDIADMNYKSINAGNSNIKVFKNIVSMKSYKDMEFAPKREDYCIIAPTEPNDIVKEGSDLSHCIASYVKDVVAERCKIFFLRRQEDVETPLASIEIRGNKIRQAKGERNRSLTKDEKAFISKWAEELNLTESYY